jgi:hypothetical protein
LSFPFYSSLKGRLQTSIHTYIFSCP